MRQDNFMMHCRFFMWYQNSGLASYQSKQQHVIQLMATLIQFQNYNGTSNSCKSFHRKIVRLRWKALFGMHHPPLLLTKKHTKRCHYYPRWSKKLQRRSRCHMIKQSMKCAEEGKSPIKVCDDINVFVLLASYVHKYAMKANFLMESFSDSRTLIDINQTSNLYQKKTCWHHAIDNCCECSFWMW